MNACPPCVFKVVALMKIVAQWAHEKHGQQIGGLIIFNQERELDRFLSSTETYRLLNKLPGNHTNFMSNHPFLPHFDT